MEDARLEERLQLLEDGFASEFNDLRLLLATQHVEVLGDVKRVEGRLEDHAANDDAQHQQTRDALAALTGRVNGVDRETAVTKAKVGLWGVAGGGSLLAVVEAIQRLVSWKSGG
jgi:hypothetical protein